MDNHVNGETKLISWVLGPGYFRAMIKLQTLFFILVYGAFPMPPSKVVPTLKDLPFRKM